MDLKDLLDHMTPDIHATMKQVVETGRWPDSRRLTPKEREACLQAVIAYDQLYLPEEDRVGYVPPKTAACGAETSAELIHKSSENH